MREGRVLIEDILKISEQLIGSRDYKRSLAIIVNSLSRLTGATRSCIMIENQQGDFVIKAGCPAEGHGVNMVVTPAIGENFLRRVLEQGEVVIIDSPMEDERTEYMRELARAYGLVKIIFIPLTYHGDAIGILTLDFAQGQEEMHLPLDLVRLLANFAAGAIGSEYERRRNEAKVMQTERACVLGRSEADLAHKFRNALTIVVGYARRAGKTHKAKKYRETRENIEASLRGAEELETFTNDLLRFANPKEVYPEPVRLNALVEERVLSTVGGMQGVEIILDPALNETIVMIDPVRIGFAVIDLVRNAVQETEGVALENRHIVVSTKLMRKKKCAAITCANNGKLIPEKDWGTIFSPFYTTKSDGTGLGLPNVRQSAELHGGTARVAESTPERTVFELILPL